VFWSLDVDADTTGEAYKAAPSRLRHRRDGSRSMLTDNSTQRSREEPCGWLADGRGQPPQWG
jgi:hypothetical protein